MKVTNFKFNILLSFIILFGCSDDDNRIVFDGQDFVRFSLVLDPNDKPIEYPQISPNGLVEVSEFEKSNLKILKIPVTLTTGRSINPISVNFDFALSSNMNDSDFTIRPSNGLLEFNNNRLSDTIYIQQNSRITQSNSGNIMFQLTDVSDDTVKLGYDRELAPLNTLNIIFNPTLETTFTFEKSFEEITGLSGESINIKILFPEGYIESEINDMDLFSEISNGTDNDDINYTLDQIPIEDTSAIAYQYIVNEAVDIDELSFVTLFQLNTIENYTIQGTSEFSIRKPLVTDRDNNTFTASNFYNLSDPFYRTYGENWMDFNEDDICEWRSFNAFTFPVVVDENHPNAILFDDMGTPNTNDDIYHHAFRIGFNSTISGSTTNAFNLKRWFTNESTSATNSPGFNIQEALEFFPTNGNSTTDGFVQVVEQGITIAGTNGNSYVISIAGQGTYAEIAPGLFEIILDFEATNEALFGGTRVSRYRIYNNNTYEDPVDLTEGCFVPIPL